MSTINFEVNLPLKPVGMIDSLIIAYSSIQNDRTRVVLERTNYS